MNNPRVGLCKSASHTTHHLRRSAVSKRQSPSFLVALIALGFAVSIPHQTSAASYSENLTVNPTSLGCGYFGSGVICTGGVGFPGGITALNPGDTVSENITYTAPLSVPGSPASSDVFNGLAAVGFPGGAPIPGPDLANVSSTLFGYSGPSSPFTMYAAPGYFHEYIASAGFCCGYGPNPGFSVTGMDSTINIITADTVDEYFYGYSYAIPYTPAVLNEEGGTVGHPVILPADTGVGAISSDIGGTVGSSEFYQFNWSDAGLFQANGSITAASSSDEFEFELVDPYTGDVIKSVLLNSGNSFENLLSEDLAKGSYEVGMIAIGASPDPQFTINFNTPVGFPGIPEPATWAMMLLGAGMIGGGLRTERRKRAVA